LSRKFGPKFVTSSTVVVSYSPPATIVPKAVFVRVVRRPRRVRESVVWKNGPNGSPGSSSVSSRRFSARSTSY
jgi:hypothetical protein